MIIQYYLDWVGPFGHPRLTACLRANKTYYQTFLGNFSTGALRVAPKLSIRLPSRCVLLRHSIANSYPAQEYLTCWPDEHGPGPGYGPVRTSVISGWYFTDGSPTAGAAGSLPPSYATQKGRSASANLPSYYFMFANNYLTYRVITSKCD
jgi:hypothetical protein